MSGPRQIERCEESGFTLLELLISIALLGLLSVALFNGLRFGTRAWEVAETRTIDVNKIRTVQTLLSDRIGRAYPLFESSGRDPGVQFLGTSNELTFLSPADAALGIGGLARVTISLQNGAIELTETPELGVGPTKRTKTLVTGVRTLDIAYFGPEEAGGWRPRWVGMARPPALVRIRASFNDAKATPWPELIIAPHIGADVACTFDPRTKYCAGRS